MAQPLDRDRDIPALGPIDHEAGEFWVSNPFMMLDGKHNFSAYERNRFFLSRKGKAFVDLSHASGADIDSDSRSVIIGDFDRDGAPDLLVGSVGGGPLRLFLNCIPQTNHRVRLILHGKKSNRSGIGTRVIAECYGGKIIRDVFPANGFMGQSAAEVILGVGAAKRIDRLTLRWPSGETQSLANVPASGVVTITEGETAIRTSAAHKPDA